MLRLQLRVRKKITRKLRLEPRLMLQEWLLKQLWRQMKNRLLLIRILRKTKKKQPRLKLTKLN